MLLSLALALCAGGGFAVSASAQGDAETPTTNDGSNLDQELEQLLTIPDGTIEELIERLTTVVRATPGERSPAEARNFLRKTSRALVDGADRILALQPNDKQASLAYQVKILGLQRLMRLGEPGAAEQVDLLVKRLRSDPREAVAAVGWQTYLLSYFQVWQSLDDQAKQNLLDELVAAVSGEKAGRLHAELVQVVAAQMERADPEFYRSLLSRTAPILQASDNQEIVEASQLTIGMARRLNLPGNEMELNGTLLDGSELDWEAYRGKVVLVDFWATWCRPCLMELPNVAAMYDAYHARGFDVVGVSLDTEKTHVESFVDRQGVPWATLFPTEPQQGNPVAEYYGITSIPAAILVDKQGKVVEMDARGEVLRAKLAELLGPLDQTAARVSRQTSPGNGAER